MIPKVICRFPKMRSRLPLNSVALWLILPVFWLINDSGLALPAAVNPGSGISKEAAERCLQKVKNLEDFTAYPQSTKNQTTQFNENEINSYLSLDPSLKDNPSMKSFNVTLEEGRLQAVAVIDFDHLKTDSSKILNKLFNSILSGIHKLTVRGKLIAEAGKAHFQLEEARFDEDMLPRFLVEEIISAVGREQNPPFDPLEPSPMPYGIERVDIQLGCIIVYQ